MSGYASPVRGAVGNRPITDIPAGLMDMLAATLRGTTKATLGLPGDIEGLGRMGINAVGGNVDPKPMLPDTERVGAMLPGGTNQPSFEKLGEFAPTPTGVGAIYQGGKKAAQMVQALRGAQVPAMDVGRRGALKVLGAGAAAAAVPMVGMKLAKELAPAMHGGVGAKAAAGQVAKAAAHAWNPAEVFALSKNLRSAHDYDGVYKLEHMSPETVAEVTKHFKNPEELKNFDAWAGHWDEGMGEPHPLVGKPGYEDLDVVQVYRKLDADLKPFRQALHDKKMTREEYDAVEKLYESDALKNTMRNPAADKWHDAVDWLNERPIEEIDKILKTTKAGTVPPEYARHGVTANMLSDYTTVPDYIEKGGAGMVTERMAGDYLNVAYPNWNPK